MEVRRKRIAAVVAAGFLAIVAIPSAVCALYFFWPYGELAQGAQADRVMVDKSSRVLTLMKGDDVLKKYRISLGADPVGPKTCQGDNKTPEGEYILDFKNPNSSFYKSIHVSYPNQADRARAAEQGCPPGGDIMIHGLSPRYERFGVFQRFYDWTRGCIAVTNEEMDELWRAIPAGTPIVIEP